MNTGTGTDHTNPPIPPGTRRIADAEVTPAMTAWAVATLRAGLPLTTILGPRLFNGRAILAVVEWHPPDAPVGPDAWHHGVSLLADERVGAAEGLDLSHYQGPAVDWSKVADSGRVFAFIKASEGTASSDDEFARNWGAAKAAGVLRGAYHFFRPGQDPKLQMSFFLSKLLLDPGELPPVLDVEVSDGRDSQDVIKAVLTAVQVLAAGGRRPIVYTSPGFWSVLAEVDLTTAAAVAKLADLWVAHWRVPSPSVPGSWSAQGWRVWQYDSTAAIPGVPGAMDADRFNGSVAQLVAFARGQPMPVPVPTPSLNPDLSTTAGVQMALAYLSRKLVAPELDPGGVDGVWGPKTAAAVLAFQKRTVTTDVGPRTTLALSTALDKARAT